MKPSRILERHNHWCSWLLSWAEHNGHKDIKPPSCVIHKLLIPGKPRYAGRYRLGVCEYPGAYALIEGETYDETIAHEVCHGFQWQLMPRCKAHGDFFFYLLRHVCGFTAAKQHHTHNPKTIKKIAALIALYEATK